MSKTYLIYGVSKGLGKALVEGIPTNEELVYGVSRSKPPFEQSNFTWLPADLNDSQSANIIKDKVKEQPINTLIYNVGIWENLAFSDDYQFETTDDLELLNIIQTNISACLLNLKMLLPNLRSAENSKIILIGSTWGLDNHNGKEVAFSATKYALRGIVQSLRETLREDKIGISIINLGYLATEYPLSVPVAEVIEKSHGQLIPLQDVVNAVRFILSTSNATCVKEITMPAMMDLNV
ncbi:MULTISPECIES: SDR family oxidoreductase [Providencia]|uniref:SDR family NAD(P)-dependent oxidoreductase n=2 Tax=Providencia TaxID=586 RepID=A0AA42FH00_9GAMM|nr:MULTISPECIES: SDR family oxidoreductase [Providencia]MBC8653400.1 SDR family oxidoreductase [Providencia vermicola]HCI95880.1 SDR family NAD(P)-dependent oxidoreductase [Providencia sp.]APC12204.1 3-oxoacyl-[acyl-carrier-protein] reductase FabG [Providencia rettgeri]AVL75559.1 SDR family NAD(P)-dependent oxidoreductase [Providencia rettgeri]EIL1985210.1 SDR family oxidoreductase [Providencia rettgeri]